MEMTPSPWLGFFRGVFLANHLASNDNYVQYPNYDPIFFCHFILAPKAINPQILSKEMQTPTQ